jgi:hypothetical protein
MTEKSLSECVKEIISKIRKADPYLDIEQPFNVCSFSTPALRHQGFLTTCEGFELSLKQLLTWQDLEPKWTGEILHYRHGTGRTVVVYTLPPK